MLFRRMSCAVVIGIVLARLTWAAPPDGRLDENSAADGQLLDSLARDGRLLAQQMQLEVDLLIQRARGQMATEPAAVESELKLTLERVMRTPALDAGSRGTLRTKLESILREAHRRVVSKENDDAVASAARAVAADQRRIADAVTRRQEHVKQLMERFAAVMEQGRLAEAQQLATGAETVINSVPQAPSTAASVARQTAANVDNQRIRRTRQEAVVQTLRPVELALMPRADDVPVVYPEASVWNALTARRAGRVPTDLRRLTPAEKRIEEALTQTASLDISEMPLADAVDYLKDLYGVEIQLDRRALADAGVLEETPVTSKLKDISLRSALRSLLRSMELTYVIADESILITTPAEAANHLSTRAYPVADLVVPIVSRSTGSLLGNSFSSRNSGSTQGSGSNQPGNFGAPGGGPGGIPNPGRGGPL